MSNEFNRILPDNPCGKVGLAESQLWNGELIKSTLVVIFSSQETPVGDGSWYWKIDNPRTLRDITRLLIILKERANTINGSEQNDPWVQEPRNRIPTDYVASQDAFDNDGQNYHTGNTKHNYTIGWFTEITWFPITSTNTSR